MLALRYVWAYRKVYLSASWGPWASSFWGNFEGQVMKENGINEHALGGSATCVTLFLGRHK